MLNPISWCKILYTLWNSCLEGDTWCIAMKIWCIARKHLQDYRLEYIWELSQFTRVGNTSPHLRSSASHLSIIWQHHTWSVIIYANRWNIIISLWGPTSSPHEMIAAFSIGQFNSSWSWKTSVSGQKVILVWMQQILEFCLFVWLL